ERGRDLFIAAVAAFYTIFMIYAGGLKFILLAAILYAPGTVLYIWARRERGKQVFSSIDWVILIAVIIGAVVGIYSLATGAITI
ncbi:arginine:ornithine antiporter / lysine permease, partial [Variovorax sp. YR216]